MRIVCSSCSAAYDVPDSLITPGRIVRCARCGGEWVPVLASEPEQTPTLEQTPAPEKTGPPAVVEQAIIAALRVSPADSSTAATAPRQLTAMERLAAHPAWPASRLPLRLSWAASLALIVFLGWAAYAWRAQIVDAWPPSARMYAAFGVQSEAGRTR